jgi:hypothetical protein
MTKEDFQQPQLPPGTRCHRCDVALDANYHGAAFWRNAWYCLTCFMRRGEK